MTATQYDRHGGDIVAEVLRAHGVPFVYTLSGGHISPILVACKARDIRVVDLRHEVNTVFAADATARLTGIPGVAVVTAGPGVTNTITALKNAQMAQSPLVLLGGATATMLKGRGALQDIDQMAVIRSATKWSAQVAKVRDIGPALERAFATARAGVPGPVFVELPVDVLYPETVVRDWYLASAKGSHWTQRLMRLYLRRHLSGLFAGSGHWQPHQLSVPPAPAVSERQVGRAAAALRAADRPLLLIGSQAVSRPAAIPKLVAAIERLGVPVYLTGMARGLLGRDHPLQRRQRRREALRGADVVVLAGVPSDFRLDYGRQIPRRATLVSANLDAVDLRRNRRPDIGVNGDPAGFLIGLADAAGDGGERWSGWREELAVRDRAQEETFEVEPAADGLVDPVGLCRSIDAHMADDSIIVADGGDFIGTAAYILRPRGPLSWLDPGPFGTLGVGAGFAVAAKLVRPSAEIWLLYGDGSVGFSLSEFDSFTRHDLPVVSVVGNDASWSQIAREQVAILGDAVGTTLARTDYHAAAEGLGAEGLLLATPGETAQVLDRAQRTAAAGRPVLVNAHLAKSDFRAGAISI